MKFLAVVPHYLPLGQLERLWIVDNYESEEKLQTLDKAKYLFLVLSNLPLIVIYRLIDYLA